MSDKLTNELSRRVNEKDSVYRKYVTGTTDDSGNILIGTQSANEKGSVVVAYAPDNTSYDGLYVPFFSSVANQWFVHVSNFSGVAAVSVTGNGYAYYSTYNL